jgi:hypothetical protein
MSKNEKITRKCGIHNTKILDPEIGCYECIEDLDLAVGLMEKDEELW